MDNALLDNHLRSALNIASVDLLQSGQVADLEMATKYVILRLLEVGPDPSAWTHDADKFPFVQGSGGWIGEVLEAEPYNYKRVGAGG